MCLHRERRNKLLNKFKVFGRKLIKGYRDRAGCVILRKLASSKIQVLLIDSVNSKYLKKNKWKLPGMIIIIIVYI